VGAAGGVAKNKVDASVSSVRDKEKVKMKRVGGEWKVVVTDKLFGLNRVFNGSIQHLVVLVF
jgi:hypothetical protein